MEKMFILGGNIITQNVLRRTGQWVLQGTCSELEGLILSRPRGWDAVNSDMDNSRKRNEQYGHRIDSNSVIMIQVAVLL